MTKDPTKKNKRSETQKAADLAFIEHWIIRGKTETQLAEMIGEERPYTISRSQIHADLMKLKRLWENEALDSRSEAIVKELVGLKSQERELWAAWEKSKLDATTTTTEFVGGDKPKSKRGTKTKITVEGRCGEPAYMRLLLDIRAQRRQLLGLDAPKEMRHLGDLESPMTVICKHANEAEIDLKKLPTEKLTQLQSILASAMSSEPAQTGNGC
jgi:hypothetical protein